jgi:hypothetical protein
MEPDSGVKYFKTSKAGSLKTSVPELAKPVYAICKNVSVTERPSLGQAAIKIRATPKLNFYRTGQFHRPDDSGETMLEL